MHRKHRDFVCRCLKDLAASLSLVSQVIGFEQDISAVQLQLYFVSSDEARSLNFSLDLGLSDQ